MSENSGQGADASPAADLKSASLTE